MQQLLGYVLGLILTGLAAYGAYEAYSTAMDGQHIESLQTQISSIEQQITTQYQRRPGRYSSFTTLAASTLISSKIVPQSAINGTAVTNPFLGSYSVVGSSTGGTPVSTFSVIADNIPESDCEQIVKSFGAGGGISGGPLYGYAVSATITGGGTISTTIPDTDTGAQDNCQGPKTATVAIQFIFNG